MSTNTGEDRLHDAEQTLALAMLLARSLSTADGLCLDQADERGAWSSLDRLAASALTHVRAARRRSRDSSRA